MENEKLVYYVYEKLHKDSFVIENKDDLIQEGFLGLIKAEQTYNPETKVKFSTYAILCIKNAMLMYFRQNKKHSTNISINEMISEDLKIEDTIECEENIEEKTENKILIERLFSHKEITDTEKLIISRFLSGYTKTSIKQEFGLNQRSLNKFFKKLNVIINDFTR